MTRILLADDDENLRTLLTEYLTDKGYLITEVKDGLQAQYALEHEHFDLCLIDTLMPFLTGVELLEQMRQKGDETPVFLMSDRQVKADILQAYHIGTDDYLIKPFSADILVCRIDALLRRLRKSEEDNRTEFVLGNCRYDAAKRTISDDTTEIQLPVRENEILLLLARKQEQIINRQFILQAIWRSTDIFSSRSLNVYIVSLRKHLAAFEKIHVVCIINRGYKLTVTA